MKICTKCGEEKPLDEYHKHKKAKDGHRERCKKCVSEQGRQWREDNKDHIQKYSAEYREKNREKIREYNRKRRIENPGLDSALYRENRDEILLRQREYYASNKNNIREKRLRNRYIKYNISLEQYNKMLKEQDYVCAICKQGNASGKALSIDHDHKCCPDARRSCGDCVRALLCTRCNTGLGQFRDDEDYLQEALNYIKKYRPNIN